MCDVIAELHVINLEIDVWLARVSPFVYPRQALFVHSYKADPEMKKASVRDSYKADIESKRSAKRCRYEEDLEENRAAKRRRYQRYEEPR